MHQEAARLAEDYRDLNGTQVQVFHHVPTALEFSRLVHISRPVVFRNCFNSHTLPALSEWTDAYLCQKMADRPITVAITPDGFADAVKQSADGMAYFTEPCSEKITMPKLLDFLREPPNQHRSVSHNHPEVYYLQSQNGNLGSGDAEAGAEAGELAPLRGDVPPDVSWATEALDRGPDAVNLWIGNSSSVTSVHSDPYENIYTVIRGQKHFTLLPPTEGYCLNEQLYPHATYTRSYPGAPLSVTPTINSDGATRRMVSWASVDPTSDNVPDEAHPIQVDLGPGDALYLPAGWWHHVRQSGDIVLAVNWWYDMEMRGMSWIWLSHLRNRPKEVSEAGNEA